MRFLVTGGAGFIGSHLVKKLVKDNHQVIVLDSLAYSGCLENIGEVLTVKEVILPAFGEDAVISEYTIPNSQKVFKGKTLPINFVKTKGFEVKKINKPEDLMLSISNNLKNSQVVFLWADVVSMRSYWQILTEVDGVFHLAAETHVDRSILDPYPFIRTDILGTYSLLESLRFLHESGKKVPRTIHVSTDEVYGEILTGYADESHPLNPSSPYSAAKASADRLVNAYFRTYKLPVIIVRPSNVYGPNQYPEKLIPFVIIRALDNQKIPIYGDGKQIRTWLFADDLVDALKVVFEKANYGETYNIPGNDEIQNIALVTTILSIMNKSENLMKFVKDRPGHDRRYAMTNDKIKRLGWTPKTKLKTGLKTTVDWYIENRNWRESLMAEDKSFFKKWYENRLK